MVLSKRERYIGGGVGAALLVLLLDSLLFTPYTQRLDAIRAGEHDVTEAQTRGNDAMKQQHDRKLEWQVILDSGLKTVPAEADSQARHAVLDWMQSAGVNLTTITPERPAMVGKFQVISFHVTGTGSMPSCARLLWSLETATIPMRVGNVTVKPRREGTDELTVDLSLSTLCMPPAAAPGDKTQPNSAGTAAPLSTSALDGRWE
jgi:hypothetical protein